VSLVIQIKGHSPLDIVKQLS